MTHPDDEYVPSVPDLRDIDKTYAEPLEWVKADSKKNGEMKVSKWRVTDAGHAYLGAIMRRNAERAIARGEGNWVQPPSRVEIEVKLKDAS